MVRFSSPHHALVNRNYHTPRSIWNMTGTLRSVTVARSKEKIHHGYVLILMLLIIVTLVLVIRRAWAWLVDQYLRGSQAPRKFQSSTGCYPRQLMISANYKTRIGWMDVLFSFIGQVAGIVKDVWYAWPVKMVFEKYVKDSWVLGRQNEQYRIADGTEVRDRIIQLKPDPLLGFDGMLVV